MVRIFNTMYANRTVPRTLPDGRVPYRKINQYVEGLRIILKWASTVPIRTIPYRTRCTCIVPYRTEIETNTLSSRGSLRNNDCTAPTVRHRGRYEGARCTVPSACAGIYMLRWLFGRCSSVSDDPVCKVAKGSYWSFIWLFS